MQSLILFTRYTVSVCLLAFSIVSCVQETNKKKSFSPADTTAIIQAILSDSQLEAEIMKDFSEQPLRLLAGPVIGANQHYRFQNKPVEVLQLEGNPQQIHERYRGRLYVGVPALALIGKDSATVSLLFYSGNATLDLKLKKNDGKWIIRSHQNGKY